MAEEDKSTDATTNETDCPNIITGYRHYVHCGGKQVRSWFLVFHLTRPEPANMGQSRRDVTVQYGGDLGRHSLLLCGVYGNIPSLSPTLYL